MRTILFISLLAGCMALDSAGRVSAQVMRPGWSRTGTLNTGRSDGYTATLLFDGKVLVAGGINCAQDFLRSTELYDPASQTWSYTGSLNGARREHSATLLHDGRVLVAGGETGTDQFTGLAELYEPSSGTWSPTGSLNSIRVGHSATLLANGKVLVVGGAPQTRSAELYDPATGRWGPTGSLNNNILYGNHATRLPDGKVLFLGTTNYDSRPPAIAELYDPGTGSWSVTASLNAIHSPYAITSLPSGKVLVMGEGYAQNYPRVYAEIYDPGSRTWSSTDAGPEHAFDVLLPNGKALVAGATSSALYDPVSGRWSSTTGSSILLGGARAILLSNGQALFPNAPFLVGDVCAPHNVVLFDYRLAPSELCPIVSRINPISGIAGSSITISGTNFTGVTAIRFSNDVNASFTIDNPNQITAVVPAGAGSGPVTISLSGCADVQTPFFYVSPECPLQILPNIRNFSAKAGAGTIRVSTMSDCAWDVSSSISWITIVAGESGIGGGNVHFTLAPNTGLSRVGEITVGAHTFTVRQGANFLDVPPDDVFYEFIGKLSAVGITTSCDPNGTMYCPARVVTREEMAVFVVRALGSLDPPPPASQRFADVPPTNPFYRFIEQMANLRITVGCNAQGPLYCPSSIVTREQMAAFIIRALGEFYPPPPQSQRFLDIPTSSPFYGFIDQMAIRGITLGCGLNLYCPTAPVTREQMAAFLARAFAL